MDERPGFATVTPYITLRGAGAAMDFYKRAFGAKELMRHAGPDGKVRHGELQIGNSRLMFCDEFPEFSEMRSVQFYDGSGVNLFLYVADAGAMFGQSVDAGAMVIQPLKDADYGRSGGVRDPYGITWWITAHRG